MKRFLATAGLVACLMAIPASASATTIVDTDKCPDGYTGIVLIVNGNRVLLCQNIKP